MPSEMKAIMLQVGFDGENGGYSAPLFNDGTFAYLPIPERRKIDGELTYFDYERQVKRLITKYLPTDMLSVGPEKMVGKMLKEMVPVKSVVPHADPEFITFTYGEQSNIMRGRKLLSLERGDYVFFFESFVRAKPEEFEGRTYREIKASQSWKDKVYCIIGYFHLESIYGYRDIIGDPAVRERVGMNAHLKRDPLERTILIATGDENSKMLDRVEPLSTIGFKKNGTKNYVYSEEFTELSGLTGQVYRSVKTIEGSHRIENVLDWLS